MTEGGGPAKANAVHLDERRPFPERPRPPPPGIEIPGYLRPPLAGASKEVPDGTAAGSPGFQSRAGGGVLLLLLLFAAPALPRQAERAAVAQRFPNVVILT